MNHLKKQSLPIIGRQMIVHRMFAVCTVLFVLVSCGGNSKTHVEQVRSAQNETHASTGVSLVQLSEQLTQMQDELRLVTKEVVSLQSKMDALANTALNNPSNNPSKPQGPAKVLLDSEEFKSQRLGDKAAKYALVEFMDYQCPYCIRHAQQVFPRIKQKYIDSGKLQYVVRDYPLNFHREGKPAAMAAECAGQQGKFWDMHHLLAKHSKELSSDLYLNLSDELKLDVDTFENCMRDDKVVEHVNQEIAYGDTIGVSGTPRFYIGKLEGDAIVNVVAVSGARSFSSFEKAIEQAMSQGQG